jgi:hypothetical protein
MQRCSKTRNIGCCRVKGTHADRRAGCYSLTADDDAAADEPPPAAPSCPPHTRSRRPRSPGRRVLRPCNPDAGQLSSARAYGRTTQDGLTSWAGGHPHRRKRPRLVYAHGGETMTLTRFAPAMSRCSRRMARQCASAVSRSVTMFASHARFLRLDRSYRQRDGRSVVTPGPRAYASAIFRFSIASSISPVLL